MEKKLVKNPKLHVRKGDMVKVLSGKDRGKVAKILKVFPKKGKAIVEGVNMMTKHQRPTEANPKGQIIKTEAAIYVCKLQVVNPENNLPSRIRRVRENGKSKRVFVERKVVKKTAK
jgi:large subunit ribosomal protein L24